MCGWFQTQIKRSKNMSQHKKHQKRRKSKGSGSSGSSNKNYIEVYDDVEVKETLNTPPVIGKVSGGKGFKLLPILGIGFIIAMAVYFIMFAG